MFRLFWFKQKSWGPLGFYQLVDQDFRDKVIWVQFQIADRERVFKLRWMSPEKRFGDRFDFVLVLVWFRNILGHI